MKVLHCPSSVIGHAWGLSRAERSLGIDSDVMSFKGHPFGYLADTILHLEKSSWPERAAKMVRFLYQSIEKYDVFHFNFGASLLSTFYFPFACDIPLITSKGKRIFATFMGCDARIGGYMRNHYPYSACNRQHCKNSWCNPLTDRVRKRRIKIFSRIAETLFCLNPDLCRFIPNAVFLPYAHVDPKTWTPKRQRKQKQSKEKIILHAPSDRNIKGTRYVLEAVRRLQLKGLPIKLQLVENTGHQEMKELIENADIVIDQLLVGWYGGFAVEAMALAKPVISYIRKEDIEFVPNEMAKDLPIISSTIETLDNVLENEIFDTQHMLMIGEKGRAYVEKWHDPLKVAKTTFRCYSKKRS